METFAWDPIGGRTALEKFGRAVPGPFVCSAVDAQQALMTALVTAELFAAKSGFATGIPVEGVGVPGYVIGGARQTAIALGPTHRNAVIYLAAQGLVRRANASIVPAHASGVRGMQGDGDRIGAVPWAVLIAVAAVAALVYGAYWAGVDKGEVVAEGDSLARVHGVDALMILAQSGKEIPPSVLDAIVKVAKGEAKVGALVWPWIAGGAFVGGAAILYFKK